MLTFKQHLEERKFSRSQRDKLAKQDLALPDGSFPIVNQKDLLNAISLQGMSNKPKGVIQAHLKKRARALGVKVGLNSKGNVVLAN